MSTHNICFNGELEKIILELSSNTPPYQVSCQCIIIRLTQRRITRSFQSHQGSSNEYTYIFIEQQVKYSPWYPLLFGAMTLVPYYYTVAGTSPIIISIFYAPKKLPAPLIFHNTAAFNSQYDFCTILNNPNFFK